MDITVELARTERRTIRIGAKDLQTAKDEIGKALRRDPDADGFLVGEIDQAFADRSGTPALVYLADSWPPRRRSRKPAIREATTEATTG